jgi:hypothetical protein
MAYNPNNPNGAAAAASSAPVAMATDQISDIMVVGQAGQSTAGNNILLAAAGAGAIDTMAYNPTLRSFAAQIIASAGITAGQILFEESNDGTTFTPVNAFTDSNQASGGQSALTISASTNNFYSGRITRRYFRCRISTAFAGGTVQAITKFSAFDLVPRVQAVANGSAGNLQTTATPAAPTSYNVVTAASTNAASVKGSAGTLFEITVSNPTATAIYVKLFNKASAPTVGTDVPVLTIPVAAGTTVPIQFGALGKRFATGIAIAATAAAAATDTAVAVAGVQINASYV